jgi:RNA polymerase sigma factor (sigma-70 family)
VEVEVGDPRQIAYEAFSGVIVDEAGEELDCSTFFYRYIRMAKGVASRYLDGQEADFVAADALLIVWQKRDRYRPDGGRTLRNFTAQMVQWRALKWLRTTEREVSLEAAAAAPSSNPGPEEKAEKARKRAALAKALSWLNGQEREFIRLRFEEGLSYQEIADVMSKTLMKRLTADGVRKRIERILKRLNKVMMD